jgi:hypothetical protein
LKRKILVNLLLAAAQVLSLGNATARLKELAFEYWACQVFEWLRCFWLLKGTIFMISANSNVQ